MAQSSADRALPFRTRTIRLSSLPSPQRESVSQHVPRKRATLCEITLSRHYRTRHYLDKNGSTREATPIMTAVVPIEQTKAAAEVRTERVGVLLVNLGTPDSADAKGVRIYLKEFLSDPRVIEDQGLLWKLVLNGVILRVRPARKARDYRKIWNVDRNESPLKTITRAQAEKLSTAMMNRDHIVVDWAMRYGNPSIRSRIEALMAQGCDRLLVVPLYPQYSAATTATVCDEVFRVLAGMRAQPTVRVTPPYYDHPDYIEALAASMSAHLASLPFQPELIVASFHGMPQKYIDEGDPYQAQFVATTDALCRRLGLDAAKLIL